MSNIDKHALLGVPKHANQHRLSRLTMEVHTDELRIMASAVESYTDELIAALEAAGKRIAELEAREVELPPLVDCSNVPFAAYSWNAYRAEAVKALRAAGITVKGDSE